MAPIRTILVVDDDNELREYLTNVLTAEGYAVLTAANGARALDVLAHVPNRCLIISDLTMPEMNGDDFVVALQQLDQAMTRFPVIILSGSDVADAWRLPGVVRVLKKPLSVEELRDVVNDEANAFGGTSDLNRSLVVPFPSR